MTTSSQPPQTRYEARGVSAAKHEVHAAIAHLDQGLYPGAFCKIIADILAGDPDYCNIQHTDGAGTKASLAYLMWKITGDVRYWRGIIRDSLFMNFDDVACAGATTRFLVSLIINRNKHLINGDVIATLIDETRVVCEEFSNLNITASQTTPCIFAGGETADVGDLVRTITVDNAITTRMRRTDVIDASRIQAPAFIVGFSSTGKAKWESSQNSSIGSNGLTSARHDTLSEEYRQYTETFSPETAMEHIYCGAYRLTDKLPEDDRFTIGEALLSPTRTYVPLIHQICELIGRAHVQGFIHCSGGGQTKIGKFGTPGVEYRKDDLFPLPALFQMLQRVRRLPWREVFETYNAGHRLEAVVADEKIAEDCISLSRESGIDAKIIGQVVQTTDLDRRLVTIKNPDGDVETYSFPA